VRPPAPDTAAAATRGEPEAAATGGRLEYGKGWRADGMAGGGPAAVRGHAPGRRLTLESTGARTGQPVA